MKFIIFMFLLINNSHAATTKGRILHPKTQEKLFDFKRIENQKGNLLEVSRIYTCDKKKPYCPKTGTAVQEIFYYVQGELMRVSRNNFQSGSEGSYQKKDGKVYFKYKKNGKLKEDSEKLSKKFVGTDEITPFIVKNWQKITKGETLKIRFPVYSRVETVGFKFYKVEHNDNKILKIKMKPSSILIAALVDPVFFYFNKNNKNLIKVVGRVAPKQLVDGKWEPLDAIFDFSKQELR